MVDSTPRVCHAGRITFVPARSKGALVNDTTRLVPAGSERDRYLPLLLLADDSESEVRAYYQKGDLYSFDDQDRRPLGATLALPRVDG